MKKKATKKPIVNHIYRNCTFSNASGSVILQGNRGNNSISYSNGGMTLNEQEREMLRLFRLFSIRQQTSELLRWYELTDDLKGGCTNVEKE